MPHSLTPSPTPLVPTGCFSSSHASSISPTTENSFIRWAVTVRSRYRGAQSFDRPIVRDIVRYGTLPEPALQGTQQLTSQTLTVPPLYHARAACYSAW